MSSFDLVALPVSRITYAMTHGHGAVTNTTAELGAGVFRQAGVIRPASSQGVVQGATGASSPVPKPKAVAVSPVVIAGGVALLAVAAFVVVRMRKKKSP